MYVYFWNDGSYATQGLLNLCRLCGYSQAKASRLKLPKRLAESPRLCVALSWGMRHLARR